MADIALHSKDLDTRIRIERPVAASGFTSAGSGSWQLLAEVWANVRDVLPSRGERDNEGLNMQARPARIRMRYRDDIKGDMRIVIGTRVMEIISGPATLGRRAGLEMIAEDYSTAGGAA